MSGRPVKRSLTLRGHRTSVSLEDAFWRAFRDIAAARGVALNALAAEIDAARGDVGLASAIRVFVLETVRRGGAQGPFQGPISHSRSASE
jgi:predicted DNA-binding ribbon-helix-helix protein